MAPDRKQRTCAIYTRKSSDEGLEQEFNSLDAQREACEAFITSQRHEGWRIVDTHYDDGGFSGGNMERPGLKRLLQDIRSGRVNVIVVYKVDRLTRSLSDFAKIVEVLDNQGASFVSVTQQFNTTTSMGRLTLNVLLSFAQFEREVTGERIRDKIAASKRKGMWMGGVVPIGYDVKDRRLVINKVEAQIVRGIFASYLRLGSVRHLQHELDREGVRTKKYQCASGKVLGGKSFSRGHLYDLLNNKLYLGEVTHRGQVFPGQHDAIIDPKVWNHVQTHLAQNACERSNAVGVKHPSLLAGLIYDDRGNRLTPTHTVNGAIRRRYYVCQALLQNRPDNVGPIRRVPAQEIEPFVERELAALLARPGDLMENVLSADAAPEARHQVATAARSLEPRLRSEAERRRLIRSTVSKVVVGPESVQIAFSRAAFGRELKCSDVNDGEFVITVPARLKRCGRQRKLIIADNTGAKAAPSNNSLVKLLERAFQWEAQVRDGKSMQDIADQETLDRSYVTRVVRLAFLAPDIVEAILEGRHKPDLKVKRFFANLPMDWAKQRRALGFPSL